MQRFTPPEVVPPTVLCQGWSKAGDLGLRYDQCIHHIYKELFAVGQATKTWCGAHSISRREFGFDGQSELFKLGLHIIIPDFDAQPLQATSFEVFPSRNTIQQAQGIAIA